MAVQHHVPAGSREARDQVGLRGLRRLGAMPYTLAFEEAAKDVGGIGNKSLFYHLPDNDVAKPLDV